MNTQVTATGMKVQAVAEDGLLIINEGDADSVANWKVSTTATFNSAAQLAPTSTSDVSSWYHNKSQAANSAASAQEASTYDTLSGTAKWVRDSSNGAYYFDTDGGNDKDAGEKYYALLNKFYIKSSGAKITLGAGNTYEALYINGLKVTSATNSSANLNKSLRVAVKVGSEVFIYAPYYTADVNYTVAGTTATTAKAVPTSFVLNTKTAQESIPAIETAKGNTVPVEIYIYFEGEDVNCKSENITAVLDTLNVEVRFGITEIASYT